MVSRRKPKPIPKPELSASMRALLTKLAQGWTTSHSGGRDPFCAVQQGKVGYGGKSEFVHSATWFALRSRGYFRAYDEVAGSTCYTLSEEGIDAARAHEITVYYRKLPDRPV